MTDSPLFTNASRDPPASGMLAGLLGRRSPGAGSLAALDGIGGLPDEVISALETRAIWAKFGF